MEPCTRLDSFRASPLRSTRGRTVTIEGWTGRLCAECERETHAGAEVERDPEKLRELDRLREQRVTWTNRARSALPAPPIPRFRTSGLGVPVARRPRVPWGIHPCSLERMERLDSDDRRGCRTSGAMNILDDKFYCYLPGSYLKAILTDAGVLDWLMESVGVQGKPAQLKRLPYDEKMAAIEHQITHMRKTKTSLWFGVDAAEIVAATIFRDLDSKAVAKAFCAVRQEKLLAKPVAAWLRQEKKVDVFAEVPMGTKRIDVMGHRKDGIVFKSDFVVAVELKNELEQFKRGLDQMTTFSSYANEVYLACTPYLAAEYLSKHADARNVHHWDAGALNSKLEQLGFGLLLVQGVKDITVAEVLPPRGRSPDEKKLKEVLAVIEDRRMAI
jgi:hypothetical protein